MRNFLFDFDSTLADTRNVAVASTQAAYKLQGLTVPSREAVVSYMGVPIEVSFAKMADRPMNENELQDLYTVFREQYHLAETNGITLFAGMGEALTGLKA